MVEEPSDTIPVTDAELVRSARGGDLRAFEQLVIRYQASVRAFAALRVQVRHDAEDLAQEVFVIAWRKLADFEPGGSFGSWLRTIAHHLVRNHRRKFRADSVGGYEELDLLWREQDHARRGEASERLLALQDCLARMDGPSLGLLNARYLEGLSVHELAESTGKGYSALTTRLYRLRELLAECVENEMNMEPPRP